MGTGEKLAGRESRGYRNDRYRHFGWCAARSDDLRAFFPARLSWLIIALVVMLVPRASGAKAFLVAWRQHGIVPGPNPGWSEGAMAHAQRSPASSRFGQRKGVGVNGEELVVTATSVGAGLGRRSDPADRPGQTCSGHRVKQ